MQAKYPYKLATPYWDTLHVNYPIKKFPHTEESRETIARQWRIPAEILKSGSPCQRHLLVVQSAEPNLTNEGCSDEQPPTHLPSVTWSLMDKTSQVTGEWLQSAREPIEEIKEYLRNYNITKKLTRSQTAKDFSYKEPEARRFNKHTSCIENEYIYPLCRKVEDRLPQLSAHGISEMRCSYTEPKIVSRLITDKNQFKHPAYLPETLELEPSWHKELAPLDTTHDGYEKYLDPYLTTSRLHHRPHTADQLSRLSASNNIVTYYTQANTTWIRTPKPKTEDWRLPLRRPKSMYDREKFKEDCREIRTHNQLQWIPRTFRTETRDNYTSQSSNIGDLDGEVRSYYKRRAAKLPISSQHEQTAIQATYSTENNRIGSNKPLCCDFDPYIEKNKRLCAKLK